MSTFVAYPTWPAMGYDTAPVPPCPRCGGDTNPDWYCSEGYCPECCDATDEERPGSHTADTWHSVREARCLPSP